MNYLGNHLLVELHDCNVEKLNDLIKIQAVMKEAVQLSGATALKYSFHRFAPQGISGVIIIAESHFTIHTWPEHAYAALDIFTCGHTIDSQRALLFIKEALEVKTLSVTELKRGNLNLSIGMIKNKSKVGAV